MTAALRALRDLFEQVHVANVLAREADDAARAALALPQHGTHHPEDK